MSLFEVQTPKMTEALLPGLARFGGSSKREESGVYLSIHLFISWKCHRHFEIMLGNVRKGF